MTSMVLFQLGGAVLGGGGAKGGGGGGDGACEKETTGRSMISHRSAIHFALNIGPPKHKVPKSGRDTHEHRAGATRLAYSSVWTRINTRRAQRNWSKVTATPGKCAENAKKLRGIYGRTGNSNQSAENAAILGAI